MDKALRHRINAGRVAVMDQAEFFARQFGQVASSWKEDDTRVTFADFAISERIFAELRRSFPRDDYCSEESNPEDEELLLRSPYAWVLDPIDGTNNYALGLPSCAISLALLHEGVPIYGYLYDLARVRLIEGGPGHGLRDGTRKVTPPPGELHEHSLIATNFPLAAEVVGRIEPLLRTYRVRSLGSAALHLGYTALGFLDGALGLKVKVWDVAGAYALLHAVGREVHFLEKPAFPLERFHVRQARCPLVAGLPEFCEEARRLLAGVLPGLEKPPVAGGPRPDQ